MRIFIFLFLLLGTLLTGCSKKKTSIETPAAPGLNAQDNSAGGDAALVAQLRQLNIAAASYQEMTGRFPESFQDLVDKKFLTQIPTAPVTRKFVLNQQTRQVQAVNQ